MLGSLEQLESIFSWAAFEGICVGMGTVSADELLEACDL